MDAADEAGASDGASPLIHVFAGQQEVEGDDGPVGIADAASADQGAPPEPGGGDVEPHTEQAQRAVRRVAGPSRPQRVVQRRQVHAAVVDLLLEGGDPEPAALPMVAQHALAAGDMARAARFSIAAASAALASNAPEEALRLIEQALPVVSTPADRRVLLTTRDDAFAVLRRTHDRLDGLTELAALADGTLPDERRAAVEARVAASPELHELVESQRRSLAATRALSEEPVPSSLVEGVEALRPRGDRRAGTRRLWPRLALVAGIAVVLAVAAAIFLSGGPGSPTVADAAALAGEPANGPPPPPLGPGSTKLAANVEGVAFPNLAQWAGWDTLGVRHGEVGGRDATVVYYGKGSRRLAYVIVSGSGLPRPSGGSRLSGTASNIRRSRWATGWS